MEGAQGGRAARRGPGGRPGHPAGGAVRGERSAGAAAQRPGAVRRHEAGGERAVRAAPAGGRVAARTVVVRVGQGAAVGRGPAGRGGQEAAWSMRSRRLRGRMSVQTSST
ncbi:hypothetical protein San01_24140 [Streptomyces angustmyceticus]|uniref:Uncharacterized protein n=1 Tax=Streptomyces angustmyceticus TaxID=285578 RepID=A0A5J4L6B9_9ACTN|nr:hypothetical protein San01_24140 [Streptomyces angustmyceticus]